MSDRNFLLLFAICVVLTATFAQLWRILALAHGALIELPAGDSLDPVSAAYLTGGRQLAFTVAVAALRSAGRLDSVSRSNPSSYYPNWPNQSGAELGYEDRTGPVETAILRLNSNSSAHLGADALPRQAYAQLAAHLQRRGLLLSVRRRAVIALAGLPLALLTCAGLLRLSYQPAPALLIAVLGAGLILIGLLACVPRATRLGMALTRTPQSGDRNRSDPHRTPQDDHLLAG